MAEPEKFFVGIIDFFSVLLPGALLTYLLRDELRDHVLSDHNYAMLSGTEGWVVFLISSYLLGHFIFLLGAPLDEHVYDPIRKASYDAQLKELAKGKALSPYWARLMASFFFKKGSDQAVTRAVALKEQYLKPLQAISAVNAFQWCKARLALDHPQALSAVQSFEAHSKFFRSLVVVLCIVIPGALAIGDEVLAVTCVPLLILAFWRFVDQRAKATNQAYWYVITIEGQRSSQDQKPSVESNPDFTHAGGVVFKTRDKQVKYLLVQTTLEPKRWVLPKGHIETEEPMREAAVREVREETGVWGRIRCELDGITYEVQNKPVKVQFYLMEHLEEGDPTDDGRKHEWFTLEKALENAYHKQTLETLRLAELKRRMLDTN